MSNDTIKCVVVGDGSVGKTSLLMCYCYNKFPTEYVPTIFDNFTVDIQQAGDIYKLCLFDTAGQDDYDRLRPFSYTNSGVVLICFSVVSPNSFENIRDKWVREVRHHCSSTPYVLHLLFYVGTQADLRKDASVINELQKNGQKPIGTGEGYALAEKIKANKYLECSALTQVGVKEVFDEVVRIALMSKSTPPVHDHQSTKSAKKKKKMNLSKKKLIKKNCSIL